MAWISVHEQMRDHPKTRALAKMLSCNRHEAIGVLTTLWIWGITNADSDGRIMSASAEDVADGIMYRGDPDHLIMCLVKTGWVDIDDINGDYILHDWDEWQDEWYKALERRAADSARKRESRRLMNMPPDDPGCPPDSPQDSPKDFPLDNPQDSPLDTPPDSPQDSIQDSPQDVSSDGPQYNKPDNPQDSPQKFLGQSDTNRNRNRNPKIKTQYFCTEQPAAAGSPRRSPENYSGRDPPDHGALIITLTLNDKTEYPIFAVQAREWAELYPAVDVEQELRNMRGWLNANPRRRKTISGILRFVSGWLANEQNRGGAYRRQGQSPPIAPPRNRGNFKQREYSDAYLETFVTSAFGAAARPDTS